MKIYKNGEIVSVEEATISVLDHGFMYGVGLFETIKINGEYPFLWKDHLERLRLGLETIKVNWKYSDEEVFSAIKETVKANKINNGMIRLNVSAGESIWGLPTFPYENPSTLIFARQASATMKTSKRGLILSTGRNTPEGDYRLKSHHYLNNLIGYQELQGRKAIEGIFLTKEGFIAEGILSNIFWVKDAKVYTPSIDTGILNGIARRLVIHLLKLSGVIVCEGFYSVEDMLNSEEVFVTNSAQEIMPISEIGGTSFMAEEGPFANKVKKLLELCPNNLPSLELIKGVVAIGNNYELDVAE